MTYIEENNADLPEGSFTFTEISGYAGVSFWAGRREIEALGDEGTSRVMETLVERLKIGVESGAISLADVVRIFPPTDCGIETLNGDDGGFSWNTWRF